MSARKVLWAILAAGVLALVVYVMANGIGLVDGLDFGAGAYYYADIPEFDKLNDPKTDFSGSAVAVVAFFLVWSLVIIGLLRLVKMIPRPSDDIEDDDTGEHRC